MRKQWQKMFVSLIALLALAFSLPANITFADDLRLLRIGTGGLYGVYYPIGNALAEGITASGIVPGLIAVAQTSGGSVANVQALVDGEIEAGLVQADVALNALRGEGPFAGETGRPVRALASLYPEYLQILVRSDSQIHNVRDFRGKAVSLDEVGSGTLAVLRIVLAAHGLTEDDFKPVYLKPEFSTERLTQGRLHGLSLVAGIPAQAIAVIAGQEYSLVPIEPEIAATISRQHPYLVPSMIPADAYPGGQEVPTLEVNALLLVHEDLDDALAYAVTAAIWGEQAQSLLHKAHSQGRSVTLESALQGISVPLHPGAIRFYQEHKLLPKEYSIP